MVDVFLCLTLCGLVVTGVNALEALVGAQASAMIGSLASAVVFLLYFTLLEGLNRGQTVGKAAARLRVVMADGTPITFAAALYRNLLRPADLVPAFYLVGILAIFTNPKSQRLGDVVAGTMVIAENRPGLAVHPAPHHVGVHTYESAVGDLRKMTVADYYALKRVCDRALILPPEAIDWSIRELWIPFAARNKISAVQGVHPVLLMEAVVMKYGRIHKLI